MCNFWKNFFVPLRRVKMIPLNLDTLEIDGDHLYLDGDHLYLDGEISIREKVVEVFR